MTLPLKANIFRDWNTLQGFNHVSDEMSYIRREIGTRKISIENSGDSPVGIAVTSDIDISTPKTKKILRPTETFQAGINSVGEPVQYLWLINPITGNRLSHPLPIRTDCNQYVI